MPKAKSPLIQFPITVRFDNGTEATCQTHHELTEEILNAHSEQSFADQIVDENGKEYGVHWSVKIVEI
jgi:hypothetical protein